MSYPLPSNWTTFQEWMDWSNVVTDGYWASIVVIAFWSVVFLSLKKEYSGLRSVFVASFGSLVLAVFFFAAGWVAELLVFFMIALVAISGAFIWLGDNE